MIVKILLIVAVLLIMALFLRSYSSNTRALSKILALIFALFAVSTILLPDWTTRVANLIGIGRGADLLLYCLVVVVVFMIVNGDLRRRADDKRFAKVVRHVSLMDAPAVPGGPACGRMTGEDGGLTTDDDS